MTHPTFRPPTTAPAGEQPCPGCGARIRPGTVACVRCWKSAPSRVRTRATELVEDLGRAGAQQQLIALWADPTSQRQTPGVHPCPGCGRPTSNAYIACADDWQQLPPDFRRMLADAFRSRTSNPAGYDRAVRALQQRLAGGDG